MASRIPCFLGGDADLSVSTLTALPGLGDFDGQSGAGRNIHYGVREHAMGGIANGLAYHGGVRTFTATFFTFSDYMRPTLRLAALSHLPVVFVFTHDSIGLGEDGPTHQPIEQLASLRAMPGMWVVRPGDANEVVEAWKLAMNRKNGPDRHRALSRQNVPTLDRARYAHGARACVGAATSSATPPGGPPEAVILATGSEVSVALACPGTAGQGRRAGARGVPALLGGVRSAGPGLPGFRAAPERRRARVGRGGRDLRLVALRGRPGSEHRSRPLRRLAPRARWS